MAERETLPTDSDKLNWASGGGAYPSADPGSPVRSVGHKPKDYPTPGAGGIIPAEDHNFLNRVQMEMLTWMLAAYPREFADIPEALVIAASDSQLFRIYPPTGGARVRGVELWSIAGTATGGGVVYQICTDGDRVYYVSGASSEKIVIASPVDGAEINEETASDGAFSSICTDGAYIYASLTSATATGLRRLLRTDGSEDSNAGAERACNLIRTNGVYCAGVSPVSDAGGVVVWSGIQGTIAEDGVYSTDSANLAALAVDHEYAFVGGVRGAPSGDDVWAIDLATRALAWSYPLPTTTAPAVASIATDGDLVYVATDIVTMSAGGQANLFILNRVSGALLNTLLVKSADQTATDIDRVAVDDRYIYCSSDTDTECVVILKPTAAAVLTGNYGDAAVVIIDDLEVHAADGVAVYGVPYSATTDISRHWMAGATKLFMRAPGDDPTRRPFHNLAVPVSGG